MARQKNATMTPPGKAAASTAPAAHRFIGTNPTKKTSGPSLYRGNVGPASAPYQAQGAPTNGGKN